LNKIQISTSMPWISTHLGMWSTSWESPP